jgi:23S rRNA (cytosine1962-C5)-methyltransferase
LKAVVKLLPKVRHRVFYGHPWVFANEVESIEGSYYAGDIVEIRDRRGEFVAQGYVNPESAILIRVLSRREEEIDEAFIRGRVEKAIEYRRTMFGVSGTIGEQAGGYRLVYSEADFLPGLIVDIFGGYLSFQTLTLGIDK